MSKFKTLKIRAYMKTGVISDQYLPLDGILYYHLVRREMPEQMVSKPGESTIREGQNITLPIKRGGAKDHTWYYNCSFAQFPKNTVEDSSFKVKQGRWLKYSSHYSQSKKIDIGSGKFKNAHIKVYYRSCKYIDWYCVGDPERIADLLRFCMNLGKNFGDGWGEVLKWEIKDWPENWSIQNDKGELMRAVPLQEHHLKKNVRGYMYGVRPSYWNPRHIMPCFLP
jgi:CRISPR type IV-associated protein Csf3